LTGAAVLAAVELLAERAAVLDDALTCSAAFGSFADAGLPGFALEAEVADVDLSTKGTEDDALGTLAGASSAGDDAFSGGFAGAAELADSTVAATAGPAGCRNSSNRLTGTAIIAWAARSAPSSQ
jgi:hypothetical protein